MIVVIQGYDSSRSLKEAGLLYPVTPRYKPISLQGRKDIKYIFLER